jgi:hypothetical protein
VLQSVAALWIADPLLVLRIGVVGHQQGVTLVRMISTSKLPFLFILDVNLPFYRTIGTKKWPISKTEKL